MTKAMVTGWVLVLMMVPGVGAEAADSKSAALARELTGVLQQRQLDSFAVVDPEDSRRFVAAMVVPGQLLVIGAHFPTDQLKPHLEQKSYREIYAALHGSSDRAGRWFVHDMGADGLAAEPRTAIDIVYEDGVKQTVFDGHPERRDLAKAVYEQQFQKADEQYSRMLQLLTAQARAH